MAVTAAIWRRSRRRTPRLSAAWYQANERRRVFWYSLAAVVGAGLLGQTVLAIGVAAVVIPAALAALAAVIWRPSVGLYLVFALVLLFEMNSPDPLMEPGRYFNYGLQSSLGVSGFIASPLELLLMMSFTVWLVQGLVRRRLAYRGGELGWPVAFFFLALVGGLLRGAAGAGDMYVAFWEARSLLYLGVCYVLAVNVIRTRRDVKILVVVFLVANGVYALEGAFRHLALIRTGVLDVAPEFYYGHEVVIFLSVLLLQALMQVVVRAPLWMRVVGLAAAPLGLYTLLATQRRSGMVALAIAFVVMTLPWIVRHRKAVILIALPALAATAIYLPLFWNNTGMLGQPARAVKSLIEPDERDASSNEYRDLEKINVRETIRSDPLLGVGFGRPFTFVVPLPDLSWWPFWHYQPHHNVLWVWLKTGALGFTVFWVLMLGALALASSRSLTLADPTLVTFAYLAIASIVASLVFCYVDLGLTNGRVTVFLGTVLGVLAALRQIDQDTAASAAPAGAASGAGGNGSKDGPGPGRPKNAPDDAPPVNGAATGPNGTGVHQNGVPRSGSGPQHPGRWAPPGGWPAPSRDADNPTHAGPDPDRITLTDRWAPGAAEARAAEARAAEAPAAPAPAAPADAAADRLAAPAGSGRG